MKREKECRVRKIQALALYFACRNEKGQEILPTQKG